MAKSSPPPTIASRLRDLRTARGLSLRDLAAQVECSHQLLGLIEAGANDPSLRVALRLADALGVSLDHLSGRT